MNTPGLSSTIWRSKDSNADRTHKTGRIRVEETWFQKLRVLIQKILQGGDLPYRILNCSEKYCTFWAPIAAATDFTLLYLLLSNWRLVIWISWYIGGVSLWGGACNLLTKLGLCFPWIRSSQKIHCPERLLSDTCCMTNSFKVASHVSFSFDSPWLSLQL